MTCDERERVDALIMIYINYAHIGSKYKGYFCEHNYIFFLFDYQEMWKKQKTNPN